MVEKKRGKFGAENKNLNAGINRSSTSLRSNPIIRVPKSLKKKTQFLCVDRKDNDPIFENLNSSKSFLRG